METHILRDPSPGVPIEPAIAARENGPLPGTSAGGIYRLLPKHDSHNEHSCTLRDNPSETQTCHDEDLPTFEASPQDTRKALAKTKSIFDRARNKKRAADVPAEPIAVTEPQTAVNARTPIDSIPIPDQSTKQVFLTMPVVSAGCSEAEYEQRFAFVVGELKKAVDSHATLCDRARYIHYDMYMVGRTRQTAVPSIVVWCKKTDTSALRALFNKRATTRLFAKKESAWARIFGFVSSDDNATTRAKPPFALVYCQTDANPTTQNAGPADVMSLHPASDQTMCGARVEYRGRSATVGLTLDVDGVDRLLTVDHLFDHHSRDDICQRMNDSDRFDSASTLSNSSDVETLVDEDMVQLRPLWTADSDEGSIVEPQQLRMDSDIELTLPRPSPPSSIQEASAKLGLEQAIPIEPPLPLHPAIAHLDWRLVSFPQTSDTLSRRQNILFFDGRAVHIQEVAEESRSGVARVYLVSGLRGVRSGTLLRNFGYIGSRVAQEMCRVWSLVLDDGEGIIPGECGSVVVDAATHQAYGHVVGSRPPGFASVVPLVDTIEQIKSRFNASEVRLPREDRKASQHACFMGEKADATLPSSGRPQTLLARVEEEHERYFARNHHDISIGERFSRSATSFRYPAMASRPPTSNRAWFQASRGSDMDTTLALDTYTRTSVEETLGSLRQDHVDSSGANARDEGEHVPCGHTDRALPFKRAIDSIRDLRPLKALLSDRRQPRQAEPRPRNAVSLEIGLEPQQQPGKHQDSSGLESYDADTAVGIFKGWLSKRRSPQYNGDNFSSAQLSGTTDEDYRSRHLYAEMQPSGMRSLACPFKASGCSCGFGSFMGVHELMRHIASQHPPAFSRPDHHKGRAPPKGATDPLRRSFRSIFTARTCTLTQRVRRTQYDCEGSTEEGSSAPRVGDRVHKSQRPVCEVGDPTFAGPTFFEPTVIGSLDEAFVDGPLRGDSSASSLWDNLRSWREEEQEPKRLFWISGRGVAGKLQLIRFVNRRISERRAYIFWMAQHDTSNAELGHRDALGEQANGHQSGAGDVPHIILSWPPGEPHWLRQEMAAVCGSGCSTLERLSRDGRDHLLGLVEPHTPGPERTVDIIFVHGLGGTSPHTWRCDRDPRLNLHSYCSRPGASRQRKDHFGRKDHFRDTAPELVSWLCCGCKFSDVWYCCHCNSGWVWCCRKCDPAWLDPAEPSRSHPAHLPRRAS